MKQKVNPCKHSGTRALVKSKESRDRVGSRSVGAVLFGVDRLAGVGLDSVSIPPRDRLGGGEMLLSEGGVDGGGDLSLEVEEDGGVAILLGVGLDDAFGFFAGEA